MMMKKLDLVLLELGHFADALHAAKVPDAVAHQMLIDWHWAVITDGVAWEPDED